jgi:hypothetical protein
MYSDWKRDLCLVGVVCCVYMNNKSRVVCDSVKVFHILHNTQLTRKYHIHNISEGKNELK